jgi:predicted nucleotidyltransferase
MRLRPETKQSLEREGVAIVTLFGSIVDGTANRESDIDVGIVFKDPSIVEQDTLEISHRLEKILARDLAPQCERALDIVLLQRAGLELHFDAIWNGKVLFEISPEFTADHKEQLLLHYADFRHILDIFDEATLEAFSEPTAAE